MSKNDTFMARACRREFSRSGLVAEISAAIQTWHLGCSGCMHLHDHLGMTLDEYKQYVAGADLVGIVDTRILLESIEPFDDRDFLDPFSAESR